jgi:exodeoxyribonuclease-3
MKITTWNVNGYRAVLKKGFKESIEILKPDCFMLAGIKSES